MALNIDVERGAESWQFFAFFFGATLTFALGLVEEIPDRLWVLRVAVRLLAFLVIGYGTLVSPRGRNWLVGLLGRFKWEKH